MLAPKREPQSLTVDLWESYTPEKLELIDGQALWGSKERMRMLLVLLYNVGWDELIRELPTDSIEELRLALKQKGEVNPS